MNHRCELLFLFGSVVVSGIDVIESRAVTCAVDLRRKFEGQRELVEVRIGRQVTQRMFVIGIPQAVKFRFRIIEPYPVGPYPEINADLHFVGIDEVNERRVRIAAVDGLHVRKSTKKQWSHIRPHQE